jgi:hypothetical protein
MDYITSSVTISADPIWLIGCNYSKFSKSVSRVQLTTTKAPCIALCFDFIEDLLLLAACIAACVATGDEGPEPTKVVQNADGTFTFY